MPQAEAIAVDGLFAKIENPQIRLGLYAALLELPRIPEVVIEPGSHGYMASLRIKRGNGWCFAIAPAQQWLLGYVRKPELKRGKLDFEQVVSEFPHAERKREDDEITVRLGSFDEISRFIGLVRID